MTCPAQRTLPPRLTLAEARRIVTDPQHGAATHPLLRHHAWALIKADHAARQLRKALPAGPHDPTSPKDAA